MKNKAYDLIPSDSGKETIFVLKSEWESVFKKIIQTKKVRIVRITNTVQHDLELSFLNELVDEEIYGIEIYNWSIRNISVLEKFPHLKILGLQCKFTKPLNFAVFKNIIVCKLFWRPKSETVFGCTTLSRLNIINYPYEDLEKLCELKKLKRLQLTSRKLETLNGIENLQNLEILDLYNCPKLVTIKGIEHLKSLKEVELEACKKVQDVNHNHGGDYRLTII